MSQYNVGKRLYNSGRYKKRKTYFKKGHACLKPKVKGEFRNDDLDTNHTWKVLDLDDFNACTRENFSGIIESVDTEGNQTPGKFLRPRKRKLVDENSDNFPDESSLKSDYKCMNQTLVESMWNAIIVEHNAKTNCIHPQFKLYDEKQKGLGVEQCYICEICMYKSDYYKLYAEANTPHKKGPKFAEANLGLATALQDMPIGPKKARLLMCGVGIAPPATSALQNAANFVGKKTEKMIEDDIKSERERLKRINQIKGLPPNAPINCSMDVRYNSQTIASSKKFGQNASQAIALVTENYTRTNEVVGIHVTNKLCWIGAHKRNLGEKVVCPGGHKGCTANLPKFEPLSEQKMGMKLGESFAEEKYFIKYLTTDGDGKGACGMDEGYNKIIKDFWNVERHSDYVHLGKSQYKMANNTKFSKGYFPGKTVEERNRSQMIFANDVKYRCHLIMIELHKKYNGNIDDIKANMGGVVYSTILCYHGCHNHCQKYSIVCNGGKVKNWFSKSRYLSADFAPKVFNPTQEDISHLYDILTVRLGFEAVELTQNMTHTNKDEGMNRAFSVSNPKNVNYSRNVRPRALSSVHRVKKGAGSSLQIKLTSVGVTRRSTGRVQNILKGLDKVDNYQREYKKRTKVKRNVLYQAIRQYEGHWNSKLKGSDYKSGQLDKPTKAQGPYIPELGLGKKPNESGKK